MTTVHLTDAHWTTLRAFLRSDLHAYVGSDATCRRFVEAVLWIDRRGAPWRLLPAEYGHGKSMYKRCARWCDQGVWERMLVQFAADPDMDHGIVDSPIVRAHPGAAGAENNRRAMRRRWDAVAVASARKFMSWSMAWVTRCASG